MMSRTFGACVPKGEAKDVQSGLSYGDASSSFVVECLELQHFAYRTALPCCTGDASQQMAAVDLACLGHYSPKKPTWLLASEYCWPFPCNHWKEMPVRSVAGILIYLHPNAV